MKNMNQMSLFNGGNKDINANHSMFFDNQVLTVKEAAKYLKISQKKLYDMTKNGKIPHKRYGGCIRFYFPELIGFAKGG